MSDKKITSSATMAPLSHRRIVTIRVPGDGGDGHCDSDLVQTDFNNATNEALRWLEANGVDTSRVEGPYIAKFGPHEGKPVGVRFSGGGYYRVEFDSRSKAHINVGIRKHTGPHIHFEGNQKTVDNLIGRLFGQR